MLGVISSTSQWRYIFLLGPVFGLGCVVVADSGGPMLGALAMSVAGLLTLTVWLWRERLFRIDVLVSTGIAVGVVVLPGGSGKA